MTLAGQPKLLDLFCCQGGVAKGYADAGFEVTGVDINPQSRYPYTFVQGDALEYLREHGHEFDAIHASPPCQHFARVTAWRGDRDNHPDLIDATRQLLEQIDPPLGWVIENVTEAPVRQDLVLCGSMFGLRVRRHRAFESNVQLAAPPAPCHHVDLLPFMHKGERAYADAMGCHWMSNRGGRQAVPPAYAEFIGRQLLDAAEIEEAA